ncbi:MAG: hypothetical protein ACTS27_01645 [Phycisphaerales bacterium]
MIRRTRPTLLLTLGSLALLAAGGLSGCAKPLFSPDEYRSQYDRFDAARGEYAEQYTFDAYGRRRPNIRGRLAPRD